MKSLPHYSGTSLARPFWSWPIHFYDALSEAVAARRRYEWLVSRGVPHDTALREALGIRISACECHAADRDQRRSGSKPVRLGASESIGTLSFVK